MESKNFSLYNIKRDPWAVWIKKSWVFLELLSMAQCRNYCYFWCEIIEVKWHLTRYKHGIVEVWNEVVKVSFQCVKGHEIWEESLLRESRESDKQMIQIKWKIKELNDMEQHLIKYRQWKLKNLWFSLQTRRWKDQ